MINSTIFLKQLLLINYIFFLIIINKNLIFELNIFLLYNFIIFFLFYIVILNEKKKKNYIYFLI
ncbi:hypothetical protein CWO85_02645 [Candidatus Phytoplasma ziziphi]|uniref:Uncharacterized protein n=1 Tax=Ziziphus jujuba witches'-broom phytoplasma TaxID=135727 RepID=A0A660HMX2_ZIZJU|nr:hypothetical protein CWO85_02645 [Candidatus Phytoplasma ziziphi]